MVGAALRAVVTLQAVAVLRASYPEMNLVTLPQANGAACLDGSPPAYWFVEGYACMLAAAGRIQD